MRSASIPTAESRTFEDYAVAREYLQAREEPMVVKASGLAAGKGVIVPHSNQEALDALRAIMLDKSFGEAGAQVVIEEKMKGPEVSIFALFDGRTILLLDPCQDFKRAFNNDEGPNTGGMGAYTPANILSENDQNIIVREILIPTVDALKREAIDYRGVIYVGIMLTHAGPKVLEYNVRFGDPECQILMRTFKGDLGELLYRTATATLEHFNQQPTTQAAVCVTIASEHYPQSTPTGLPITGIEDAEHIEGVTVFHAGTARKDGQLVTAGGRVLSVTATADTLTEARQRANEAAERIQFPGARHRTDIAASAT